MTQIERRYVASFVAASGRRRYVGEGAMMPFTSEEARLFETKEEAKAALARIGAHHKLPSAGLEKIAVWKGVIAKPTFMLALGL